MTGTPINPTRFPPYLTLITYQFLHANIWHLLGNMIFLWVFGDDIEEAMGSLRFIGFYLVSGVVAALVFAAFAALAAAAGRRLGRHRRGAGGLSDVSALPESIGVPAVVYPVVLRAPGGAARCLSGCSAAGCWCSCGRSRCRPRTASPIWRMSGASRPGRCCFRCCATARVRLFECMRLGGAETGAQPGQLSASYACSAA